MDKKALVEAIDTLKLYRRAELIDSRGQRLVGALYVDPLADDHVLNTVLKPNTTFLIGRKGTGKSTIFQSAQEALDQNKAATWAYIDIKTLFESSSSELAYGGADADSRAVPPEVLRRILVFRAFTVELVREIKSQIDARISNSVWDAVRERFTGSKAELFDALDEFVNTLGQENFLNATGVMKAERQEERSSGASSRVTTDAQVALGANPELKSGVVAELLEEIGRRQSSNYAQIYVRVFGMRGLIRQLSALLKRLGLRHLYIFIDDFSELRREDMEEIVDSILAPFNNWSDEFIKLKVAVYPGRIYFGDIDRSKVDEVYLDVYRAYGRTDVAEMEERAVDFTRRLVTRRVEYFCKAPPDVYFELAGNDVWRELFFACLGNPRILGYVLYYCYETHIAYGKKINVAGIRAASRRYYEEKLFASFRLSKFLHETFGERSSIYSLRELLEEIVKRAKHLRTYTESKVMQEIKGRPPTSHFHVASAYDEILSTLELNFFITKYYEMKDRDGREVSVYALNNGLCQSEAIAFGRPTGSREHRLYFVERVFDYTPLLLGYVRANQEIVCSGCNAKHSFDLLAAIQAYDMLCPSCKAGRCRVVNLSRKYEALIQEISPESLLPPTELGILQTLHDANRALFANDIAQELDCSYQLVGKRSKHLAERSLVSRNTEQGRRVFSIRPEAQELYFTPSSDDKLDFGDDSRSAAGSVDDQT